MARCHIRYAAFLIFRDVITNKKGLTPGTEFKCPKNVENLSNLCMLYGLYYFGKDLAPCYEAGYFSTSVDYPALI